MDLLADTLECMTRHFLRQWVILADTQANLQSNAVNETLCETKYEALVDTLASSLVQKVWIRGLTH